MQQQVKRCFGWYGNRAPEGFDEKSLGCTLLCRNVDICRKCYWKWYFLSKNGTRIKAENFIREWMFKKKLKYGR